MHHAFFLTTKIHKPIIKVRDFVFAVKTAVLLHSLVMILNTVLHFNLLCLYMFVYIQATLFM